jgi:hypothetical protein
MPIDPVFSPRRCEQLIRTEVGDPAGSLSQGGDPWQRPGKFSVPADQGASSRSPIAIFKAEIGPDDNMQQPIGWHGVGIVVGRKQAAIKTKRQTEGIPVPGRQLRQAAAIGSTAKRGPASARTAQFDAIRSPERVGTTKIFSDSEDKPVGFCRINRQPAETVVGVAGIGLADDQRLRRGCDASRKRRIVLRVAT